MSIITNSPNLHFPRLALPEPSPSFCTLSLQKDSMPQYVTGLLWNRQASRLVNQIMPHMCYCYHPHHHYHPQQHDHHCPDMFVFIIFRIVTIIFFLPRLRCQASGPGCSPYPRYQSWATPCSSSSENSSSYFFTGQ